MCLHACRPTNQRCPPKCNHPPNLTTGAELGGPPPGRPRLLPVGGGPPGRALQVDWRGPRPRRRRRQASGPVGASCASSLWAGRRHYDAGRHRHCCLAASAPHPACPCQAGLPGSGFPTCTFQMAPNECECVAHLPPAASFLPALFFCCPPAPSCSRPHPCPTTVTLLFFRSCSPRNAPSNSLQDGTSKPYPTKCSSFCKVPVATTHSQRHQRIRQFRSESASSSTSSRTQQRGDSVTPAPWLALL